jgi:hypothetical protein
MPARYRLVKINGRSRLLHRHLMEQHLGRALLSDEHVHHRNGNRFDNRLENLEVLSAAAHMHLHKQRYPTEKACVWCGTEFTPHPTKRKRAETCSKACGYALRWARRKGEQVPAVAA